MSQVVRAEMVASVHSVLVTVDEPVDEGATLVILESMKMEIPVLSPCAGRVASLTVGEGDDVSEGQQVATVEA